MKKTNLLYGFLAGCSFMLLISAQNQSNQTVEIPRYYISPLVTSTNIVVYDAVTGEFTPATFKDFKEKGNLKNILNGK